MDERRIRRYGSQSARWDAEFRDYHRAIVAYVEYHCLTLHGAIWNCLISPVSCRMKYRSHWPGADI